MKLSISISQSNLLNVMWLLCNGYFRILLCCIIILHYAAYIAMTSHQYFCYTPFSYGKPLAQQLTAYQQCIL